MTDYRPQEQVGHLLRRAHQRATAIFLARIGDASVTPTQFATLVQLHQHGELSQNHLGRLTAMDPATVQGVIRRLGQRGLVAVGEDPDDRRRARIALTAAGEALVIRLLPNAPRVGAATLEPLTEDERDILLHLLRKLG